MPNKIAFLQESESAKNECEMPSRLQGVQVGKRGFSCGCLNCPHAHATINRHVLASEYQLSKNLPLC